MAGRKKYKNGLHKSLLVLILDLYNFRTRGVSDKLADDLFPLVMA